MSKVRDRLVARLATITNTEHRAQLERMIATLDTLISFDPPAQDERTKFNNLVNDPESAHMRLELLSSLNKPKETFFCPTTVGLHKTQQNSDKMQETSSITSELGSFVYQPDQERTEGRVDSLEQLVADFAGAVLQKARQAQAKRIALGKSGTWQDNDWQENLISELQAHVAKGDPRDVAIYSMFAWYHGWHTGKVEPYVIAHGTVVTSAPKAAPVCASPETCAICNGCPAEVEADDCGCTPGYCFGNSLKCRLY
jgi:hypothetical protein